MIHNQCLIFWFFVAMIEYVTSGVPGIRWATTASCQTKLFTTNLMNNLLIIFTQMIGTATISVHNNLCVTLSIIGVTICSIRAKKRLAYTNNDNNRPRIGMTNYHNVPQQTKKTAKTTRMLNGQPLWLSISKRLPYKVQPRLSSNSWAGGGGLARLCSFRIW